MKAYIVPLGKELEGSDDLVPRNLAENVAAEWWNIGVIEELDPEEVDIKSESDFRKDAARMLTSPFSLLDTNAQNFIETI